MRRPAADRRSSRRDPFDLRWIVPAGEHAETVKAHRHSDAGQLDHPPRAAVVVDVAAPGQRLERDPDAVTGGQFTDAARSWAADTSSGRWSPSPRWSTPARCRCRGRRAVAKVAPARRRLSAKTVSSTPSRSRNGDVGPVTGRAGEASWRISSGELITGDQVGLSLDPVGKPAAAQACSFSTSEPDPARPAAIDVFIIPPVTGPLCLTMYQTVNCRGSGNAPPRAAPSVARESRHGRQARAELQRAGRAPNCWRWHEVFAGNRLLRARGGRDRQTHQHRKRMIYYYFGGKNALPGRSGARLPRHPGGRAKLRSATPVREAIRRLAEVTFDHHIAHDAFIRLVAIENIPPRQCAKQLADLRDLSRPPLPCWTRSCATAAPPARSRDDVDAWTYTW